MKYVKSILYIVISLILVWGTYSHVQAGDICRTIYGCFALWLWFQLKNN